MPDSLDPRTRDAVEALTREISVAHELDGEIQKELGTHIEDKVLAYLNGAERLAPEDALILARAHFGNPATVRQLLSDVHHVEAGDTLARRIAAAMLATVLTFQSVGYTCKFIEWFIEVRQGTLARFVVDCLGSIAAVVLLWVCLRYWQRRLNTGRTLWFCAWPAWRMCLTVAMAFALLYALQVRQCYLELALTGTSAAQLSEPGTHIAFAWYPGMRALIVVEAALTCLIWIVWCDRGMKHWKHVAITVLAWLAYEMFLQHAGWVGFFLTHFKVYMSLFYMPGTARPVMDRVFRVQGLFHRHPYYLFYGMTAAVVLYSFGPRLAEIGNIVRSRIAGRAVRG